MQHDEKARTNLLAERERLQTLVSSLDAAFAEIVDATTDVATDDEHDPEGHTLAFERQQQASLLDGAQTQLAAVELAVRRLDDGSYGRCVSCGQAIPDERLEALPATDRCVDCAVA